jgi:polar amino acid transport system substrate-binding protein
MQILNRLILLVISLVLVFVGNVHAQIQVPPSEEVLQQLTSSGQLRLAFPDANLSMARLDPESGEWAGPGIELGRILAARLGVPLVPVPVGSPNEMLGSVGQNVWDIALIAIADRENFIFTRSIQQVDQTFLVMPGVDVAGVGDADREGIRIMVLRSSIYDYVLTPIIKNAELIRIDGGGARLLPAILAGESDLLALTRTNLLPIAEQISGSRVLEDRFAVTDTGFAFWEEHTVVRDYIDAFVTESLQSGLVAELIANGGISAISPPTVPSEAVLRELAPTGSLRFAFPKDAAPMAIIGQELGRILAKQLGVPYLPYHIDSPEHFLTTLGQNEWDILMMSYFERPGVDSLIYTVPALEVDHAFLVRPDTDIQRLEDVDKPGIRIAVRSETIYDYRLREIIEHAEIQAFLDQSGQQRLETGEAEVLATTRSGAIRTGEQIPGSYVLAERFGYTPVVFALSEERTAGRDYAERFIREQIRTGVVARLIEESGLDEGIDPGVQ